MDEGAACPAVGPFGCPARGECELKVVSVDRLAGDHVTRIAHAPWESVGSPRAWNEHVTEGE